MRFALTFGAIFLFSKVLAYQGAPAFEQNSADYKVLVFLSKDCPCSNSHVAHLNQLSSEFKNIPFYGVIADQITTDNSKDIDDYFNDQQFKFPVLQDREQKLVRQFNALKTPHVSLLKKQKNGQYTAIYEGGVTNNRHFPQADKFFLKEDLLAIQQKNPLPYASGKSLGCYIRRF